MSKSLSVAMGLWGFFLCGLGAQPSENPILPAVAPFSHWRVDYTYPEPKKSPDSPHLSAESSGGVRLVSIEYILTGRTGRVVSTYSDSSTMECYWKDRYEIAQVLPNKEIRLKEHAGASGTWGLLRQYPGLEWVNVSNFVNLEDTAGQKQCFHFKKVQTLAEELNVDSSTLDKNPEVIWELWTSSGTGQPILFTASGIVRRYTFLPLLSQPIELPPEYQAALNSALRPFPRPGQAASRAR
jgi:hypothetical protein